MLTSRHRGGSCEGRCRKFKHFSLSFSTPPPTRSYFKRRRLCRGGVFLCGGLVPSASRIPFYKTIYILDSKGLYTPSFTPPNTSRATPSGPRPPSPGIDFSLAISPSLSLPLQKIFLLFTLSQREFLGT